MKKYFLLVLTFLITGGHGRALEIVYPKKNPVTINAPSTFFIGSARTEGNLEINGLKIELGKNGAFAQTVPLSVGKNEFKITETLKDKSENTVVFVIERPAQQAQKSSESTLIEYPPMSNFCVKAEGTPLRSTPVNSGINRMSHLPKGMQLTVTGEKNGFYRIFLNSKTTGWIDKSNIESIEQGRACGDAPVKIKHAKSKLTKEFYIYEFKLERQVPFALKEENGVKFELFNIEGQPDNTLCYCLQTEKLQGYEANFEEKTFVLKVRRLQPIDCKKPLKDITITIDAGHGGIEVGAIGCLGEKEKDINLAIAKNLQKELKKRGAKPVMTREEDIDVSLSDRVNFAKEKNSSILVSIHANALPDCQDPIKSKGTSVYYYHPQAKPLAESILNFMTTQLGTQNDKVRQGSLALVRPTASVSVLIEVAYMINPDDIALLKDEGFQAKCAKAIADGIEDYLRK